MALNKTTSDYMDIKQLDTNTELYIGALSGTSIDSIDTVIIALSDNNSKTPIKLIQHYSHPIPDSFKQELHTIINNKIINIQTLGEYHRKLGILFTEAVSTLLKQSPYTNKDITAIGLHGQTVFHQPELPYNFTLQLGCASTIRELTQIPVITDFRQRDMIHGGQGAPLAPLIHQELFSHESINRAIVNIGGICNITLLPSHSEQTKASDLGPGNTLLDQYFLSHNPNSSYCYDHNGSWAASGSTNTDLLNTLLADPYFNKPWPKSTGREYFNLQWLQQHIDSTATQLKPEDIQCTLVELSARQIIDCLSQYNQNHQQDPIQELYLCGGGVHNTLLVNRISKLCQEYSITVNKTDKLGAPADWVEAILFAWLAYRAWHKQPLNLTAITGSQQECSHLGCIYY